MRAAARNHNITSHANNDDSFKTNFGRVTFDHQQNQAYSTILFGGKTSLISLAQIQPNFLRPNHLNFNEGHINRGWQMEHSFEDKTIGVYWSKFFPNRFSTLNYSNWKFQSAIDRLAVSTRRMLQAIMKIAPKNMRYYYELFLW